MAEQMAQSLASALSRTIVQCLQESVGQPVNNASVTVPNVPTTTNLTNPQPGPRPVPSTSTANPGPGPSEVQVSKFITNLLVKFVLINSSLERITPYKGLSGLLGFRALVT